ncbi:MAG: glycosyltransferase involved in cell wall biosynthesis [Desulforhopalus sp.]|jgi:glycosyltransferase involved in cell wall biosynthesis
MRFSIIIPSYNSAAFLEETLHSIVTQRADSIEVELIVVDAKSGDGTPQILEKYRDSIDILVVESDTGPANAINKGLALATGEIVAWLNADDVYNPGTLKRVADIFCTENGVAFGFGKCSIVDEQSTEIRQGITRFKELFFPLNSRFTYQCINYISQPATFFSREAYSQAGPLREDMVAAWDYEFFLRLWQQGHGHCIKGPPLSSFRWHEQSISGQNFHLQFKEELDAAIQDAGRFSLQTLFHTGVRWGIVGAYSVMAFLRSKNKNQG